MHRRAARSLLLPAEPARNLAGGEPEGSGPPRRTRGRPRQGEPAATADRSPESEEALRLARRIVDLVSDKQASDVLLLDIRGVSLIADYFVICSAGSERQTTAIVKDLTETLPQELGRKPLHLEGRADSGWVLLDYGDVIVHVFSPALRAFYNLEQLWSTATPVVRLQ